MDDFDADCPADVSLSSLITASEWLSGRSVMPWATTPMLPRKAYRLPCTAIVKGKRRLSPVPPNDVLQHRSLTAMFRCGYCRHVYPLACNILTLYGTRNNGLEPLVICNL